jgi:Uma2 family endonuclease
MSAQDKLQEDTPRLATEVAELFPPQKEWTEADYFSLPDTNRIVELSEGELIMPPHPTYTHQRVVKNLVLAFQSFVREHNLGLLLFAALPIRLWVDKIREPDIVFFSHAHADRIGEQFCGPPDLAVEIISPSTRRTDRVDKFVEYARAGVSEYWLVDPDAQTIEVYVLEGGAYTLFGKFGWGEHARSQLLSGFEVAVEEAFAK